MIYLQFPSLLESPWNTALKGEQKVDDGRYMCYHDIPVGNVTQLFLAGLILQKYLHIDCRNPE